MKQNQALTILKTGKSVFITGEPGSGKTHTINRYIDWLKKHSIKPAVTASTGIAATHINGRTIHSWSGIGLGDDTSEEMVSKIAGRKQISSRLNKSQVLIIDEISMLSGEKLDLVERVCRAARKSPQPFGGMQVVLAGDFFQLPPISREQKASFAYEAEAWKRMSPVVCYIKEQYRQEDNGYFSLLSEIRSGRCSLGQRSQLMEQVNQFQNIEKGVPRLYTHNVDVDRINDKKLAQLSGKKVVFEMDTKGPSHLVQSLQKNCLSPAVLELKRDASVIFTKNSPKRQFVNGTLGKVVDFDGDSGHPVVKTRNGKKVTAEPMEWTMEEGEKVLARVKQVPLRLAWAITVHKSQGMSMDAAAMDLSNVFEYGQGYVALSRVRHLQGLYLLGLNSLAFEVDPEVLAQDEKFRASSQEIEKELSLQDSQKLTSDQKNFIRYCGGKTRSNKTNRHNTS